MFTWEGGVHLNVPVCKIGRAIDGPDKLTLHLPVIEANPPPDPSVLHPPLVFHLTEVVLEEGHLPLVDDFDQ